MEAEIHELEDINRRKRDEVIEQRQEVRKAEEKLVIENKKKAGEQSSRDRRRCRHLRPPGWRRGARARLLIAHLRLANPSLRAEELRRLAEENARRLALEREEEMRKKMDLIRQLRALEQAKAVGPRGAHAVSPLLLRQSLRFTREAARSMQRSWRDRWRAVVSM